MHVVVMGVTGCGKSTVGGLLAASLGAEFADGDGFHSEEAVAKMASNIPLTDADRWPWLARVGAWLAGDDKRVVACSALKRAYRDAIRDHAPDVVFVHLNAPQDVLEARVAKRARLTGHFAGPGLLDSQFAILEALAYDERGVVIDVTEVGPDEAVALAREALDKES